MFPTLVNQIKQLKYYTVRDQEDMPKERKVNEEIILIFIHSGDLDNK